MWRHELKGSIIILSPFTKRTTCWNSHPKYWMFANQKKVTQRGLVKLVFQYSCSSIETLWVWNQATPNVIKPWINTDAMHDPKYSYYIYEYSLLSANCDHTSTINHADPYTSCDSCTWGDLCRETRGQCACANLLYYLRATVVLPE